MRQAVILRPIIQCWMPAALLSPRKLACEQLPHQFFLYIYIYLLGTRVTLLRTEGGAAQAGLIPRPDLHWPRWPILPTSNAHNPIPLIYISLSAHVRCVAMRKHMAATLTAAQMSSRSFFGDTFESIYSDGTNGIYDIEIVTSYHYSSDLRPIPVGVSFLQNVQEMQPTYVFATNLRLFFRRKVILNIE